MDKLKPCPFCGSEECDISEYTQNPYVGNVQKAYCKSCGANGPYSMTDGQETLYEMKQSAIKQWNHRVNEYLN